MGDPDVWPVLLDMSRDDSKRILRRLELEAYSNLVSVLRAQGSLTPQKRRLLQNVAQTLSISEERHKAECRRAFNSEKLATISKHMGGANSGTEWAIEGRRLVPLLPRLVPQTAFTAIADKVANMAMTEDAKLPLPTPPVKKQLMTPPIDEALLEPNVPEASKTPQISSASPLSLSSQTSDFIHSQPVSASTVKFTPKQQSLVPRHSQQSPVLLSLPQPVPKPSMNVLSPSSTDNISKTQLKQDVTHGQVSSSVSPLPTSQTQLTVSTSQPQASQSIPSQAQSQVVLLVKKDDRLQLQDDRVSRKRSRSTSFDLSLDIQTQESIMSPPVKKEAPSPPSPPAISSHLVQSSSTISPQSHSQLLQQQTLQAAAAAATAAAAAAAAAATAAPAVVSSTSITPRASHQQQQLLPHLGPTPQQPQLGQLQLLQPKQQTQSQGNQTCATSQPSSRTLTIPSQGTVKLSLSSTMPGTAAGLPHKVIIVSSTTPSILQRSLSVPVVKSISTSAPSQPCTSALVLNPAQQSQLPTSSTNINSGGADTTSSTPLQTASVAVAGKPQRQISSQATPKVRSRANSIVIPVTPNQANVMNSVAVTSMQLKSALQAGKQAVLKSGDTTGLKIMPIASMGPNTKILPKTHGSGPIYVVSSTSSSNSAVPMVTRSVPSGTRVMTFTSSLPKVAVSTSQGGAVLSMTSKPVQTLQLTQSSSAVTSVSNTLSSASGKPNVIVVQKGTSAFGRGVTLSHAGKEVVGKVLLSSKGLTSLNQNQLHGSTQIQALPGSPLNSLTPISPSPNTQTVLNQSSRSSTPPQSSQPVTTSASTRRVTVQKLPSAVVQGPSGSSNVIVLDLSQEQFNNSAVLNEILASSILQSSNVLNFNNDTINDSSNVSVNKARDHTNFSNEQCDVNSGLFINDESGLVEDLDLSNVNHIDVNTIVMGSDVACEYSSSTPGNTNTGGFFEDDSSIHDEPSSSSSISNQPSRGCSDIFTTALSNANLNLNDFLDDGSLDCIQSTPVRGAKIEVPGKHNDVSGSSSNFGNDQKVENWVTAGISHTSPSDDPEINEA